MRQWQALATRFGQRGQREHAPERSVSLIHLQRSATEAHRIECSQSEIVADESRKLIERVPVHRGGPTPRHTPPVAASEIIEPGAEIGRTEGTIVMRSCLAGRLVDWERRSA